MDEQDFCDCTAVWNSNVFGDETSWECEPDDVVESRGTLYVWENVKPRPASSKGNLFAMQNGEKTLSFFAGVA